MYMCIDMLAVCIPWLQNSHVLITQFPWGGGVWGGGTYVSAPFWINLN